MGIPRSLLWLVVTGVIVAGLVGISYLALEGLRPNAEWSDTKPHCPHCRADVAYYGRRCPACREEFDWVVSPEEDSPWCASCVLKPEMDAMRARSKTLGETATAALLAKGLALPEEAAGAWWKELEPGRCGWCGGSGRDLGGATSEKCPVCFGEEACIGCDGDLRTRLGNERAARDRERMKRDLAPWQKGAADAYWREFRLRSKEYLRRYSGTLEATQVGIAPGWLREPASPPLPEGSIGKKYQPPTAAAEARRRVDQAIRALAE